MDKEKDVVSWNSNDNVYGAKLQVVVIWIFLKTGCHFVEWHIIQKINKKQKKKNSIESILLITCSKSLLRKTNLLKLSDLTPLSYL
jgi:hypothetical protein